MWPGRGNLQADRDQFQSDVPRWSRLFGQVLCMVQDEAQRDGLVLGPGQRPAEGRHLPGGDIGQVSLPGAQRVGRRAAPIQLGERGFGQLGLGGQGEGGHFCPLRRVSQLRMRCSRFHFYRHDNGYVLPLLFPAPPRGGRSRNISNSAVVRELS